MRRKVIILVMICLVSMTVTSFAEDEDSEGNDIPTRFGKLTVIKDEENIVESLLYKNRPLSPAVQGYRLGELGTYQIGNVDVILIEAVSGGNACPSLLYFVTVSKSDVKTTDEFGTCSDLIDVKRVGNSIVVTMPNNDGGKQVYVFKNGVLTENGKVIK